MQAGKQGNVKNSLPKEKEGQFGRVEIAGENDTQLNEIKETSEGDVTMREELNC